MPGSKWQAVLQWRGTLTPEEFFHLRTTRAYRKSILWGRITAAVTVVLISDALYTASHDTFANEGIASVLLLASIFVMTKMVIWVFRAGLGQMFTNVLYVPLRSVMAQPPPRFTRAMSKQWRRDVWIPGQLRRDIGPPVQDTATPDL
ncbi:MAG TPA: hypothetical protein VKB59_16135 [Micromonosporaceae bacterium]|nr:hypothetical protein [Micromonosporaceae bacterium]